MLSYPVFVLFSYIALHCQGVPLTSQSTLETYIRYCGTENLCTYSSKRIHNDSRIRGSCPACDCDKTCHMKGTCCPDYHLNTCVDISLDFESESPRSFDSVYMISKCPPNTEEEKQELCESTLTGSDAVLDVPVKGVHTNISYKNKHCAECNGEQVTIDWGLSIEECMKEGFDINVYSSFQEINAGIKEYSCNFGYDWTLADTSVTRCQKQFIRSCNVSGLWDTYDQDIEWACKNSHNPFTFFSNVFCYHCNVGRFSIPPLITSCPEGTEKFLDNLCLNESDDPVWFPYKNDHCYRCRAVDIRDFGRHYYSFNPDSEFPYELTIALHNETSFLCNLVDINIYKYLRLSNTLYQLCYPNGNTTVYEEAKNRNNKFDETFEVFLIKQNRSQINVDFPSLYKIYELFGGRDGWCFNGNNYYCSCETNCFEKNNCCPDMVTRSPYDCIMYGKKWFELITKCPLSFSDEVIRYYCERQVDEFDSIVDYIPVVSYPYQYRNIFCYMCSFGFIQTLDLFSSWYFRTISFKCPFYLNLDDSLILSPTYAFLNEHCQVEIQYTNKEEDNFICARFGNSTFNNKWTCPKTDKMIQHKEDIVFLCENTGLVIYSHDCSRYKNIFCDICEHIEYCNAEECPYRMLPGSTNCYFNDIIRINSNCLICIDYRHIFAVRGGDEFENRDMTESKCDVSEHGDPSTGLCRFASCSPGKEYKDRCTSLLSLTKDLQFSLTIDLNLNFTVGNISVTPASFVSLLNNLNEEIIKEFESSPHMYVSNIICYTNQQTSNNVPSSMYITVYVRTEGIVSRDDVEEQLFTIKSTLQQETYDHDVIKKSSGDIPIDLEMYDNICHSFVLNNSTISGNVISVDKFLKCRQFILKDTEYIIYGDKLSLTSKLATSELIDFMTDNEGKVRVCVSDYVARFKDDKISLVTIWDIIPAVCVCTSILCLLLMVTIFIVLKQFKTLPGKNILCLIISQLFAQSIFLVKNIEMQGMFCMVIGGLNHFAWLTMFFATTNCSYHIHRALSSDVPLQNDHSTAFIKSLVCVLFGPMLIVAAYMLYIHVFEQDLPYRSSLCFISDFNAQLIFFHVPVSAVCLINLVFFVRISYILLSIADVRRNGEKRNNSVICCKLFLITGLSWILQLVDAFFPSSLFTYIVTVVNGCQGMLIFLVLTFSKNIRNSFRLSFTKTDSSNTD